MQQRIAFPAPGVAGEAWRVVGSVFQAPPEESDASGSELRAGDARGLARRLWHANPLLASTVLALLRERPHARDELYKHLNSAVYRGVVPSRPAFEHWLGWAALAGVIRPLGVAVALAEGEVWEHNEVGFDAEAFLAQAAHVGAEAPEDAAARPLPEGSDTAAIIQREVGAAGGRLGRVPPAVISISPGAAPPEARRRELMLGLPPDAPTAIGMLVKAAGPETSALGAEALGIDGEQWQQDPGRVLMRLGVVAALAFRAGPDGSFRRREEVIALHRAIERAQLFDALIEGTLPDTMPTGVDAAALLLVSVVARRVGQSPALVDELAIADDLSAVIAALDRALGRGLLVLELFWLARVLAELGVVRYPGAQRGVAIPWRPVRDALVRWSALTSPYATDLAALVAASAAAAAFATGDLAGDTVVLAFEALGGCGAWAHPPRQGCSKDGCLPFCRERAELA